MSGRLDPRTLNLSFAGCGFLGVYHMGVASCFREYAPGLAVNKVSGASAGALAAAALLVDIPLGSITSDILQVVTKARKRKLGPFSPDIDINGTLKEGLIRHMPVDAYKRVNGRLHVSLTRVYDGKNVVVSEFDNNNDLLNAILCTAFIPFFSGWVPPKYRGIRYMDGCWSNNLPVLDENTVTVSPWCGESDICPRDDTYNLLQLNLANTSIELSAANLYRFTRILFPPSPEVMSRMCQQGFDDALRFLQRNDLISCTRCVSVRSYFHLAEPVDSEYLNEDADECDPSCRECLSQQKQAVSGSLPESVMSSFQDAIESSNRGLLNKLLQYKSMKILSIVMLPYIIPMDIAYASFLRMVDMMPKVSQDMLGLARKVLSQLFGSKSYKAPQSLITKLHCEMDVTRYNTGSSSSGIRALPSKHQFNFDMDLQDEKFSSLPRTQTGALHLVNEVKELETWGQDMEAMGRSNTYVNIIDAATHEEPLMTYYYRDDNDKLQVTEIFDVTRTRRRMYSEEDGIVFGCGSHRKPKLSWCLNERPEEALENFAMSGQ